MKRVLIKCGWLVTLDPAGQKRISIYSVNQESLRVALYAVTPEDYGRFASAMRARLTYPRNNPQPPFPEIGRRVFADTVKLEMSEPLDPSVFYGFKHPSLNNEVMLAFHGIEPSDNSGCS